MANGYIGKISALVTASTADLSRKLQGSTRDVNRFANSIQSQIAGASRSAQASLNGIFTPLQRIQRALVAGRGLNLIDSKQVAQIQRAVSVAEGINKPLAAATRQFEGLSAEVQAAFLPALDLAQRRAAGLNDLLARSGSVSEKAFTKTAERIGRVSAALQQLRQAQQITASAPSGNELQFTDPGVFAALQASAEARRKAASPEVVSSVGRRGLSASLGLGDQIRDVARLDELITQAAAKINSIRLTPQVDTSQLEAARGELSRLIALQGVSVEALNKVNERAQAGGAGGDVEALIKRERGRKQIEDQLAADAKARADAEIALLIRKERGNKQIEDQLAADARSRQDAEIAALIKREQLQKRLADGQADQDPAERVRRRAQDDDLARQRREEELTVSRGQTSAIPAGRQGRARILETLGGEIDVVEGKVQKLPDALRSQLGPEVNKLTNAFRILGRDGVGFAVDQADKLAARAREITAALNARQARGEQFLEGFGGAGAAGLNLGIDERELLAVGGQIEFLQNKLSQFSAEVRGPAVAALQVYREVVNEVFKSGAQNTDLGRKAISDARNEVVRLAAQIDNVKPEELAAALKRVGDVARGAGSKAGLAIQQAAFAFEDFFSVTGGLDQRIRAAGNNISQLGFIIGSTKGLIIGISAAIGAQLIASLIKFANNGKTAEDQTKSLNDALAKQKTLVDELKSAFQELGSTIADKAFSGAAGEAQKLQKRIEELIKKQRELREERVASLDSTVQKERASQAAIERQLEGTTDAGQRVILSRQLQQSQDRERAARQAAIASPATGLGDINEIIAQQFERVAREAAVRSSRGSRFGVGGFVESTNLQGAAGRARGAEAPVSFEAAVAALDAAIEVLSGQLDEGSSAGNAIRASILRLQQEVERVRAQEIQRQIDEGTAQIAQAAIQTASVLQDAGEILDSAADVPGAAAANARRAMLASQVEEAANNLEGIDSQEGLRAAAALQLQLEIAARGILEEARSRDIARQAIDRFAAALDRASQEAQANLQSAQQAADEARRADLGRSTPATRQAREQADADLARQRELATGVEEEVAAARERFRQRVSQQGQLRRRAELAEEARRINQRRRDEQRAAFTDEEDMRFREIRDGLGLPNFDDFWDTVRESIDNYAGVVDDAAREAERALSRIAEIDAALQPVGIGPDISPRQREELARERARLEQQAVESDEQVRRARDASTREAEQAAAAARGRELGRTPAEKAGRDLAQGLRDLEAARDRTLEGIADRERKLENPLERIAAGPGMRRDEEAARAEFEKDRRRLIEDAQRSAAPAIFALADQVANAVVQGPSRAALQATDVSTVEGSRELNRLLRGDDSARDQNLVELQKQSQSLDELVRIAREGGAQIAN